MLDIINGAPTYLLRDEFHDTRAAGSVNGTAATPTGGVRTVVDTGNHFSVGSGVLSSDGGTGGWGDPRLTYPTVARARGRLLIARIVPTSGIWAVGFANGSGATPSGTLFKLNGTTLAVLANVAVNGTAITVGSVTAGQTYDLAIELRDTGAHWLAKGGTEYTNWTELYASVASNIDPVTIGVWNNNGVFTVD